MLIAPNHFSIWDHFFCGVYLRRRISFMAKSQLFATRLVGAILTHGGAFPVRRGQRDEEAITTARSILDRGGAVVVYPAGGRSRDGKLGTRAARDRTARAGDAARRWCRWRSTARSAFAAGGLPQA